MCSDVFQNEEVTLSILIKYLQMLLFDRVVNVRVTLAKVISDLFRNKTYAWTLKNEHLLKIANTLKKDKNRNVYNQFEGIELVDNVPYTEEESIDSNFSFTNKMTILKEEFGITRNLPVNAKVKLVESPKKKSLEEPQIEKTDNPNDRETDKETDNNNDNTTPNLGSMPQNQMMEVEDSKIESNSEKENNESEGSNTEKNTEAEKIEVDESTELKEATDQ